MGLSPGTKLGQYEIVGLIGAGGMGEVYRARDSKLKRDVAIKALPDEFSRHDDRLVRFQREAEVLASLNHSNIASIYDLQEANESCFLIMELVPGETLAERVQRGPAPLNEALAIAKQIADGLDAAHEKGIIHRDLKPANIKITPDGQVKILDFGLARSYETGATNSGLSNSPTLSMAATNAGIILGTAAYMSPEQAKGRQVDKRADIWAFGVVLYELLTGRPAFQGEDVTETLAAVVMKEPDLKGVPVPAQRLIRKCLQKNPKSRLRDVGDAWELVDPENATIVSAERPSTSKVMWLAAVSLGIAFASLALVHFREAPPVQLSGVFNISLPPGPTYLMISPDGRNLAFVSSEGGPSRLWIRPLNSLDAHPILGTEGATFPFWSPDGENIGFFAQGKLKKIAIAGGPAQTLYDAPTARGGAWNRDGVILFAPNISGGLFRIAADGGAAVAVTKASAGEARYPEFIEGGNRFLFSIARAENDMTGIYIGSLDDTQPQRLLPDVSHALYVPASGSARSGFVLFIRETTAMALPFDAVRLSATGPAVPVAGNVMQAGTAGFGALSASANGILLYRSGDFRAKEILAWVDRFGRQLETKSEAQPFSSLSLSADEKEAAVTISTSQQREEIWLQPLESAAPTKLTFEPDRRRNAVWSPDGTYIVYSSAQSGEQAILRKAMNNSGGEEILQKGLRDNVTALDISHDGKLLVFSTTGQNTKDDLWLLRLQGDHKTVKYLDSPFEERHAQFSPDDKWIAYSSDESGQFQIYVQPVPATGAKFQISTQGGVQPRWRRDGKELYYLSAGAKLMAVPVSFVTGTINFGSPRQLWERPLAFNDGRATQYQPSSDGQKFLVAIPAEGIEPPPVTISMNWTAALKQTFK